MTLAVCLHVLKMDNDLTNIKADHERLYFFLLVVITTLNEFWVEMSLHATVTQED